MQKKAIEDKKSMLLLNLTAKKQQLRSGVSFHPQMDKNRVVELNQEIEKMDKENRDIAQLQKKYKHHERAESEEVWQLGARGV
eukprot:1138245-Pelagomonas_calceolata.AAC.3